MFVEKIQASNLSLKFNFAISLFRCIKHPNHCTKTLIALMWVPGGKEQHSHICPTRCVIMTFRHGDVYESSLWTLITMQKLVVIFVVIALTFWIHWEKVPCSSFLSSLIQQTIDLRNGEVNICIYMVYMVYIYIYIFLHFYFVKKHSLITLHNLSHLIPITTLTLWGRYY